MNELTNALFIIGFVVITIYIIIDLIIIGIEMFNFSARKVGFITSLIVGDILAFALAYLAYDETNIIKIIEYYVAILIILMLNYLAAKELKR